jgi:hypothetical protein
MRSCASSGSIRSNVVADPLPTAAGRTLSSPGCHACGPRSPDRRPQPAVFRLTSRARRSGLCFGAAAEDRAWLMPAKDVKAHVKRNKNDAADAEAICEAVRRPTMRFVGVKSAGQQGRLMQHRNGWARTRGAQAVADDPPTRPSSYGTRVGIRIIQGLLGLHSTLRPAEPVRSATQGGPLSRGSNPCGLASIIASGPKAGFGEGARPVRAVP